MRKDEKSQRMFSWFSFLRLNVFFDSFFSRLLYCSVDSNVVQTGVGDSLSILQTKNLKLEVLLYLRVRVYSPSSLLEASRTRKVPSGVSRSFSLTSSLQI